MAICTYSSLAKLRIFKMYKLVPKNSDERTLLFVGAYLCRLNFPMCFNYLNLVNEKSTAQFMKVYAFESFNTGNGVHKLVSFTRRKLQSVCSNLDVRDMFYGSFPII
jgi:hypothetical protein